MENLRRTAIILIIVAATRALKAESEHSSKLRILLLLFLLLLLIVCSIFGGGASLDLVLRFDGQEVGELGAICRVLTLRAEANPHAITQTVLSCLDHLSLF